MSCMKKRKEKFHNLTTSNDQSSKKIYIYFIKIIDGQQKRNQIKENGWVFAAP